MTVSFTAHVVMSWCLENDAAKYIKCLYDYSMICSRSPLLVPRSADDVVLPMFLEIWLRLPCLSMVVYEDASADFIDEANSMKIAT